MREAKQKRQAESGINSKELGRGCRSERQREGEREGKVTATQKKKHREVEKKENQSPPDVVTLIRPNWSRSVDPCLALQSPEAICLIAVTLGFVFAL